MTFPCSRSIKPRVHSPKFLARLSPLLPSSPFGSRPPSLSPLRRNGPVNFSSLANGTGNLFDQGLTATTAINFGFGYAFDPQDRFIFELGGIGPEYVVTCVISPVDGTANTCGMPLYIGFGGEMLVESSGQFLYMSGFSGSAAVFSIDQTTGDTTELGSLSGIVLAKGNSVADPMGPYIYSADPSTTAGGVHAYLVDQQTGNLSEIPGSPFNP